MDKLVPGLIIVAIVVLVFAVMWRSWRRRASTDAAHGVDGIPEGYASDQDFAIQYVATTKADQPLERLALPGLGFRGYARLSVAAVGASITVTGEDAVFLPAPSLRGIDTAHVTIDRAVEPGGLVRISWTLPDGIPCDSYVRFIDPSDQRPALDALQRVIPTHRAQSDSESESKA